MDKTRKISLTSLKDLEIVKDKLGSGSFAQVRLVRHKQTNTILALKEINLETSLNYGEESKLIKREINVHKGLIHPNIIR